jgi:hypothetical protein
MLMHWLLSRILFAPETEEGTGPDDEVEDLETEEVEGEEAEEPEEGTEAEEAEGEEGEEPPAPSRKETRVQRLANEARTEREKNIRLEALLEERARTSQQQPDNRDAERQRAEKLALMDPAEKAAFLAMEETQSLKQQLGMTNIQMRDFKDEAKYDAIAATNTHKGRQYAKHKDFVEEELQKARQRGMNPSREAILALKLGQEQLNAKPSKKLPQRKQEAAGRVAAAQGKPMTSRGGESSSGGKKGDSLEDMRKRILAREARGEAG